MTEHLNVDLREVVAKRNILNQYRDDLYVNMIKQINTQCQEILKDDLGSQFVGACSRDLAGEIVRNFFDTSSFHITVDQLARRILEFKYDGEYDPLKDNSDIEKYVFNYNEQQSATLDIITDKIDKSQEKLFKKEPKIVKDGKEHKDYIDRKLISDAKDVYIKEQKELGQLRDGYTGKEGEYVTDKNGKSRRRLQVEHTQALAAASYTAAYLKKEGIDEIKKAYNSKTNFSMMIDVANQVKGDVRVLDKSGNDITFKATPKQYCDAIVNKWENTNKETKEKLISKGYLNPNGTVPKHIKIKLADNLCQSQNAEGRVILKNVDREIVAKDAAKHTGKSVLQIVAGQIIYYITPPLVYEVRKILQKKTSSIEHAIQALVDAGERIGDYLFSKLNDVFENILVSSLKNFVKVFMDIIINLVKATIKKMAKFAKNLVLSTVDAVKILATKGTTPSQKADSVCNLFAVTMTTFVVDTLFESISLGLYIPEFLIMPLQILITVICTNLIMVILQKMDLFDLRFGFKMNAIRDMFEKSNNVFNLKIEHAETNASEEIALMIKQAKIDCLQIYQDIMKKNPYESDVQYELSRISKMFGLNVEFGKNWQKFVGNI